MNSNPLRKEFYMYVEFSLYLVGHGPATLGKLVPRADFVDGSEVIYATVEDWGASHLVLADFDQTPTTSGFLLELAHTMLGDKRSVALLYMDSNYEIGTDF